MKVVGVGDGAGEADAVDADSVEMVRNEKRAL